MIPITFEKFKLSNGLEVVLHEDHTLPLVAVNLWYHVGSKDEEPGRTGFAHLFEHVMFEGSKHHNRSFFDPLQKVGAMVNGSTSTDRTNYWVTLPSNYLELALWLESDRMGYLLDALDQKRFDIQRDVVKNERRQSYENRPYGMAHLLMQPAVFPKPHPYNWPTIGTPEDLDAASLEDVKAFFRRYYAPNNASLALAGDFDTSQAMLLVERYFGDIPPAQPTNRIGRMDTRLEGSAHLVMYDNVQLARAYLGWPALPAFDPMRPAMDVLGTVLGDGKTSRLHRKLVYEQQSARDVAVYTMAMEIAGETEVVVTAAPGHKLDDLLKTTEEELERIQAEAPSEEAVTRAKNRIETEYTQMLEHLGGFGGRADQLNYFNVYQGDPGLIGTVMERYRAVTPEDVHRAASLLGGKHVRLDVLPRPTHRPSSLTLDRAVMPAPTLAGPFTPPVPVRRKLANGLNILHVERRELPLVSVGLLMKAGAAADPAAKPGLSHFTATMLQEGTKTRTSQEISEALENLGTHLDLEVGREQVLLSMDVLRSNWVAALELLSDVVTNPSFPAKELERVRKERLTDLKRVADDPTAIAGRVSRALLYGSDHPYGHPATGTEASVAAFSREDLVTHAQERFVPGAATLVVVGQVTLEDAMELAQAAFGGWKGKRKTALTTKAEGEPSRKATTIYLADKRGAAQSVIYAGQLTVPRHHPDYHAMNLLNLILGGQFSARLNMNLRQDKGYTYGYMSSIDWVKGPSAFLAGGSVQTKVTKEAVAETLKEMRDIRHARPVTEEEFEDARQNVFRGFPSAFESQGQVMHQVSRMALFDLPETYFQEYLRQVEAISLGGLHRVAEERLNDGPSVLLVVGDMGVVESGIRELELETSTVDYEGRVTS
jgi:zinc protease